MITKHERKVYAWLRQPSITYLQLLKMRRAVWQDVLRLMTVNNWRPDYLRQEWVRPGYVWTVDFAVDCLEEALA